MTLEKPANEFFSNVAHTHTRSNVLGQLADTDTQILFLPKMLPKQ